ncbi:ABC transporter permease [Oceanobacillus kapialis]|uniref:ABC transporter permease n=1 Tax=Oceanobacillus kapialis TaxID=481353 RepID=A0ABW5PXJ1_9BACI
MKLLKFEWKKMLRQKKFLILFLIVLACVLGMFYRNVVFQENIAKGLSESMIPHLSEVLQLQQQFEEVQENENSSKNFQVGYENAQNMKQAFEELQMAVQNENWAQYPKFELNFLQTIKTHLELGGTYNSISADDLAKRMEKDSILIELQLPYEDEKYSLAVPNFMKVTATTLFSVFGIVLLVLMVGNVMTGEYESNSIKMLYTQPLKKSKAILSKYMIMVLAITISIVSFLVSGFIFPHLFGGNSGSFSYPQLVNGIEGYTYITTREYLIKYLILFFVVASFALSLVMLLSIVLKNRFSTMVLSLTVLSMGIFLTSQLELLQTIFNPFYFFLFQEVMERFFGMGSLWCALIPFIYSIIILMLCIVTVKKEASIQFGKKVTVRPFRKGKTLQESKGLSAIGLFEWRKLIRQGYIQQIFIGMMVLIIGGYVLLTYLSNEAEQDFIRSTKAGIKETEEHIIPWEKENLKGKLITVEKLEQKEGMLSKKEKDQLDRSKTSVMNYQNNLEHTQSMLEMTKSMLNGYQQEEWQVFYEYWLYQNRLWKGEISAGPQIGYVSDLTNFTFKASIAEKEWLTEKEIPPVLPVEYVYNIYEDFPNKLDMFDWKRKTQRLDHTGLFYTYSFFNLLIYLIPLAILIFLLGTGFSNEKGERKTLHFLKTQPLSRAKIYIGKAWISLGLSIAFAIGLLLFMLVLGSIGNRFGDWEYPVLHYDTVAEVEQTGYKGITSTEGGFHFIAMGDYVMETSLLFISVLVFLVAMSLVISLFFNNNVSTIMATAVISIGGYFLSQLLYASGMIHLLPFTYLNIGKIANGEMAVQLNNTAIETWVGISSLLVSTGILLVLGIILFCKKSNK